MQAHIHFGPPAINGGIRRSGRKSASGCVVTDLSQCIDAGGGPWLFFAGGNAYQDSSFFATGLAAEGSATVSAPLNMPGECGPGTSEGLARSVFSAVFSTDQAYRVTVDDLDTFRNASLTLTHDTGSGPALLYSVAGTVPVGYDEVVGAGVFNLFIQAESDEHLEDSNFNVLLGLEDPPPPVPGAGRVSQLVLGKSTASPQLQLAWQPSCSFDDDTYAIFGGDLSFFDSHTPETCSRRCDRGDAGHAGRRPLLPRRADGWDLGGLVRDGRRGRASGGRSELWDAVRGRHLSLGPFSGDPTSLSGFVGC